AREREDKDEGPDDQVRNHLEFRMAFVKVEPPLLHLPSIRGPFRSTEATSPHGGRYEAATYLRTGTGSGRPRRDPSRENHEIRPCDRHCRLEHQGYATSASHFAHRERCAPATRAAAVG